MKKKYSILLTGDATGKTLNKIISNDYEGNEQRALEDIFSDVICHLSPHHGSDTNNSNIWSECVVSLSEFPSINIISSNPKYKNGKPSFKMIKKFINSYEEKLKNENENEYYKYFYCIPHYISCNLNTKIFKCHS